ncbi:hypothetical protein ARMSODRAFT_969024 [Armillaria solidipes]|uniref:Uncharacterized protein n=1 Tax=Armillaria solidipes TaxID=1076256 RepID=A0A2H3CD49_9AGAR|nr:hypothetical protein ARMSODRAFT_969024 [Armillaria solidipes]
MIWRCWMVWGRRWSITLLPALYLVSAVVFKIIYIHRQLTDGTINDLLTPTMGRTNERGLKAYRHVVEVLIESSALCSVSLILFVAFFAHNDWTANYLDPITGIARGVAPTLLVGRVAAGHARPDESWEGSIMTSLRFWQGTA